MAAPGQVSRPSFPALDPEPAHHPWTRRLGPAVALAGALALVGAVLWLRAPGSRAAVGSATPAPGRDRGAGSPAAAAGGAQVAAGGRVVSRTPAGALVVTDPGGGHRTTVAGVRVDAYELPVPSADGRVLALGGDQLLELGDGTSAPHVTTALALDLSHTAVTGWADGGRALVVVGLDGAGNPTPQGQVRLVQIGAHPGAPVALGTADTAVGDGSALGAFVAVASTATSAVGAEPVQPDARVELRDAGRRPVVVTTAARLDGALGLDPSVLVNLQLSADPSGTEVAVTVVAADVSETQGIVVLDRAGHVLGTAGNVGDASHGVPAWSPNGRTLTFATAGTAGQSVTSWTIGGSITTRTAPGSPTTIGTCLWSPDGTTVLCPGYGSSGPPVWLFDVAGGPIVELPGAGTPIAWAPAPSPSP